jgi:N-acetyl-gamma-glutamyl-phosphate reductase
MEQVSFVSLQQCHGYSSRRSCIIIHLFVYLCKFKTGDSFVLISAAIVGASGYSGVELIRILSAHPDVEIKIAMAGKSAGEMVESLYPDLAKRVHHVLEPVDPARFKGMDVAFLALPSGESMGLAPGIVQEAGCVIDLSGDFRLKNLDLYREFYGREQTAPDLLKEAVYGLPELNRELIASARFVSNPGCYPTGALLALLPALQHRVIDPGTIVINSLSGTSGAGRSSNVALSFTEVNENVRAYRVGTHQHIPEIESVLSAASGQDVRVTFTPHLIPISRGIFTTITAERAGTGSRNELLETYRAYYRDAPYVRVVEGIPEIKNVTQTNFCDVGLTVEERTGRVLLFSTLDNMVKGAAGQAVQNMNIMFGLPQECALR